MSLVETRALVDPPHPAPEPHRWSISAQWASAQTTGLVFLAWFYVVVPRMIQSILTADKYRTSVGDTVTGQHLNGLFENTVKYGLMGWCIFIAVVNLRRLPTDRRVALLVLLLPWVYIACRDLYINHEQDKQAWLYPLFVFAVWVLRPRLERLASIGVLASVTAVASMALAIIAPRKGLFVAVTGDFVSADKEILPIGILVGPFTSGNNLAQLIVLGLPFLWLLRSRVWRTVLAAPIVMALVWTSSRSSLAAAAVGFLLVPLLLSFRRQTRSVPAALACGLLGLAIMLIPLTTSDPAGYTNRGVIWMDSLRSWWTNDIAFGLGSNWYARSGVFGENIVDTAFHAHNEFVQIIVTGGLVGAAVVAGFGIYVTRICARWAAEQSIVPTVFLAALFTSCTLEVTFGFVDRTFVICSAMLGVIMVVLADRRSWTRADPLSA